MARTGQVARFYMCRVCEEPGQIEKIAAGFSILNCPKCHYAEILGPDVSTLEQFRVEEMRLLAEA